MSKRKIPQVTFIIPTRNEERNLERCLSAIRNQIYPQQKIEILVVDAKSEDRTIEIAHRFKATVISNPGIHQEPGKTKAAKSATGHILFYTDADNVLAHKNWLTMMTHPFMADPTIAGFLPQTLPPPDSNLIDTYLGYLTTDPFTWFIYGNAATPRDYGNLYIPIKQTPMYSIYSFPLKNHPLIGLAQGFGVNAMWKRKQEASGDDIMAGINIIEDNGRIVYVPKAGIYHYHIDNLRNFIRKYSWRVRNNLYQTVEKMGLIYRRRYYSLTRKVRMGLFIPYALTLIFPLIDATRMSLRFRNPVMFLHIPLSFLLALLIMKETTQYLFVKHPNTFQYYEQ